MRACDPIVVGELDQLLRDELPSAGAQALRDHLDACAGCARALRWARVEREALKRRAGPGAARIVPMDRSAPAGLAAIRARAAQLRSGDRRAARRSALLAIASAAAAVLVAVQAGGRPAAADPVREADGTELSSAIPWCGESVDPTSAVERAFSACLTATPRALPGSPAVCL
jgi:anti-sigma factor RsiW